MPLHDTGYGSRDGSPRVLVVDDDAAALRHVMDVIAAHHPTWSMVGRQDGASAIAALARDTYAVAVVDLVMPDIDGMKLLAAFHERDPDLPVVMLTASDRVETAVECMRRGAYDFQVKPAVGHRLARTLANAVEGSAAARARSVVERGKLETHALVGDSGPMLKVHQQIRKVAHSNVSVLVHGETGSGKELVAQAIHRCSPRAGGPWVTLNCGAIPEHLQESLLFGHEKGAFTGASSVHRGSFELASHGTLFLDEVGELSPSTQVRLLRVLQEGTLQRVGGSKPIDIDVRVVSATHRDLRMMLEAGTFREDLYYRLVVYPIAVPPLRDRANDIEDLVWFFVRKYADDAQRTIATVDPDVLLYLRAHAWPGNVRELENVVRRAMLNADGTTLGVTSLPPHLQKAQDADPSPTPSAATAARRSTRDGLRMSRGLSMADSERVAVERALKAADGNVTRAAACLGIARATVYRKMARYGINARD